MKRKLFILLFALSSLSLFSQDYKQKIAKASCECTADMKSKNISAGEVNTQFGLCVIKSSMPYSKELKKEYGFDIKDMGDDNNDPKMDVFFQDLSMLMMTECSDTFFNFLKSGESKKDTEKESVLSGSIVKIEKSNFVVFHLIDENKNLKKLNWVTPIESNLDLPTEYNTLLNKKVTVNYYVADIFDVNLNDYRNLNVISSLKTD